MIFYHVLDVSGLLVTKDSIGRFENSSTFRLSKADTHSRITTTRGLLPPRYADKSRLQTDKPSATSHTNPPSFITTQNPLVFPNERSTILETAPTRLALIQMRRSRPHDQESPLREAVVAMDGPEINFKTSIFDVPDSNQAVSTTFTSIIRFRPNFKAFNTRVYRIEEEVRQSSTFD